jgi:ATP-dependent Clp protease adaptor protein ClpS
VNATAPDTNTHTSPTSDTQQPRPWAVVLLDDDEHSFEYVIELMQKIFAHPIPRAQSIAKQVDAQGRAVCLVTHKELAELKQEQIHSFGRDARIAECAGAMSAIIEPAQDDVPSDDAGTP